MKKISFILLMLISMNTAHAQIGISTGLTFVPQASLDPAHIEQGFNPSFNLFPQVTIAKDKFFAVGLYSIVSNASGLAVGYTPTEKITTYIVGTKSSMTNANYLGVGIGTPLANKKATGFIEFGINDLKMEQKIYIGMFIPFDVKIK